MLWFSWLWVQDVVLIFKLLQSFKYEWVVRIFARRGEKKMKQAKIFSKFSEFNFEPMGGSK